MLARNATLATTVLGVVFLGGMARGQIDDGGPIIIGEQKTLEFFRITNDYLAFEFEAEFRSGETDPETGKTTKDTETRYKEILEYGGIAFFGHPDLFELDYLFRLELEQRDFDLESVDQADTTSESILELDVRGTFIQRSDTPITIFAVRNQTNFQRDFAGTLDNTFTEIGASVNILNGAFPSYFTLSHIELEQENSFDRSVFEQKRDLFEWSGSTNPGEWHRLWWEASVESVDESGNLRRPQNYDRAHVAIYDEWEFGKEQQHRLRSTIRLRNETGDLSYKQFRWDERLFIEHSNSFDSNYILLFDQSERHGSKQTLYNASANFQHQLFDSLITSSELSASQLDLDDDDFTSTDQRGRLGLDYTKTVPYGILFATAHLGVSFLDESDRGSSIFINDESHTFGPAGIIVISRRNVVSNSIVITDITGLIFYSEGFDYDVNNLGERVEIRRIPGGLIAPNQTVLVDYEIGPEPGSDTTSTVFGFTSRYEFDDGPLAGLALYGRYRELNQDRDSDNGASLPTSDYRETTFGAEYTFWRFSLLAEQKNHDSDLSPFDSTKFEAEYRQFFGRDHLLLIRGFHQIIDRKSAGSETTLTNINARFNSQLSTRWRAEARVIYREESDSIGSDFRGFEQHLELSWQHRQTAFTASLNNIWSETDANTNEFQTFAIGFRREF